MDTQRLLNQVLAEKMLEDRQDAKRRRLVDQTENIRRAFCENGQFKGDTLTAWETFQFQIHSKLTTI